MEEKEIEKEVDNSAELLKTFADKLKDRVKELDEIQPETFLLKDESLGLTLELSSHKKSIEELNRIGLGSFLWLKDQRKIRIPVGVG